MQVKGTQVVLAVGVVVAAVLVISLIATVVKWLVIIALIVGVLAIAQFVRDRRR